MLLVSLTHSDRKQYLVCMINYGGLKKFGVGLRRNTGNSYAENIYITMINVCHKLLIQWSLKTFYVKYFCETNRNVLAQMERIVLSCVVSEHDDEVDPSLIF